MTVLPERSRTAVTPPDAGHRACFARIPVWMGRVFLAGLVPFASLVFVPMSVPSLYPFDTPKRIVLSACVVVMALHALRRGPMQCRRHSTLLAATGLLLCWISMRSAMRPNPWAELGLVAGWILPLLLFAAGLSSASALPWVAGGAAVAALVQAAYMLLQYGGWDPVFGILEETASASGRMLGTIGYHNQAAGFLGIGMAAVFMSVRSVRLRWAVLAVPGLALLASGSRGALIAVAAAGAAPVLYHSGGCMIRRVARQWRTVVCLLLFFGFLAVSVLILWPGLCHRWAELLQGPKLANVQSRLWMWRIAGRMWMESPLAGWGGGEYALQYVDRLGEMLPAQKSHATLQGIVFSRHAHNEILQFGAEFGLLGVMLVFLVVALAIRRLIQSRQHAPLQSAFGIYLFCYLAFSGLASFPLQGALEGPVAALLAGCCCAAVGVNRGGGDEKRNGASPWLRAAPLISGGAGIVLLVFHVLDLKAGVTVMSATSSSRQARLASMLPPWAFQNRAILGGALAVAGDEEEAIPVLERALTGYCDVRLLKNLSYCLMMHGRLDDALAVLQRWRFSGLDHRAALRGTAVVQERIGLYPEAVDALEEERRLWPSDDGESDIFMAWLLLKAGSPAKSADLLRRTRIRVLSGPDEVNIRLHRLLAGALLASGQMEEAIEAWRHLLTLAPNDADARHDMAQGLERMGRHEEAQAILQLPSP